MDWLSREASFRRDRNRDEDIRLEVEQIAKTLKRMGVTGRRRLAQIVGAHYWYKGEFDRAIGVALAEGKIREVDYSSPEGDTLYAPPEGDDEDGSGNS